MEFQPTPGTYAAVDPFKPSISFSIKNILGSQRAPRDDTDLNSPPPPRVAIPTRTHGAIWPPINPAFSLRHEAPRPAWRAVTPIVGLPPPNDFQHVRRPLKSALKRSTAGGMDATSTDPRQRTTSHSQNSEFEFQSRHRSRSSSPSDRNRGRCRSRSPPLNLRDSSPQFGSSRVDEQPRQTRNSRSRHHSKSPSPSVERIRERSPSQRRRHSRSRSRSPVRSRRRKRGMRRHRSPSSRSDARAPVVLIPESSPNSSSAALPLDPPPIVALPPSREPELTPLPSSLPSPIIIQSSPLVTSSTSRRSSSERSTSARAQSRTPSSIVPPHARATVDGILSSPTRNPTSQPGPPEPDFPPLHPSVPSVHSIPSPIAEETDVQNSIIGREWGDESNGWRKDAGWGNGWDGWGKDAGDGWGKSAGNGWEGGRWGEWDEWGRGAQGWGASHSSAPHGYPLSEEIDASCYGSYRQGAVNLASEPLDEKRPVGPSDSFESVHLMTYVAAFALDTLPRQLYLHFLLRLPYMYFSRVTRIFEEADMSMPQIKQGILEAAIQLKEPVKGIADAWKLEPVESVQYSKLENTWQSFIDSLMKEWKTLNIISVLLLS